MAPETCTANGIWDSQPCVGESRCEDITGEALCVECMEEWWADLDADGTGDPENTRRACQQPDNYLRRVENGIVMTRTLKSIRVSGRAATDR